MDRITLNEKSYYRGLKVIFVILIISNNYGRYFL